jgi:hypothetical protein
MRWIGYAACKGEMRNSCKILIAKPQWKRPFGVSKHWGRCSNTKNGIHTTT